MQLGFGNVSMPMALTTCVALDAEEGKDEPSPKTRWSNEIWRSAMRHIRKFYHQEHGNADPTANQQHSWNFAT